MIELALGSNVIELLIPHRRPLAMVDGVAGFERAPHAAVATFRHVSANEPIFEGHFPGLSLWPGVYTIEGMGQTVNILLVLDGVVREYEKRGGSEADALEGLRNLERGYRLAPGFRADKAEALLAPLRDGSVLSRGGMTAAVDVKLLRPVFAGQRIDYRAMLTHTVESLVRCEVSAEVDGQLVAKGTMSSTLGIPIARIAAPRESPSR